MLKNVFRTLSRMGQSCILSPNQSKILIPKSYVKDGFTYCHSGSANVTDGFLLTPELLEKLAGSDETKTKKLKLIEFECEFWRQEGKLLPSKIKEKEWEELLDLETRSARAKFLEFLFKREKIREREKAKRQASNEELERVRDTRSGEGPTDNPHHYGINFNTIFLRLYNTKIDHFNNSKCINAIMYGQPLIFDLGFDKDLTVQEQRATAKQLAMVFHVNRTHDQPFNLQLLNCNMKSVLMKSLHSHIPIIHEPYFPPTVSSQNYLDLYPKEKLVYLTPHTKNVMKTFDEDRIYIVGGIVDRSNNLPLTLAKAKRENIEMVKFPLETYLPWGSSASKMLTLDAVVSILLEFKTSGDWRKAFTHIPKRKLKTEEEILMESRYRAMRESRGMKKQSFQPREPSSATGQKWNQRPEHLQNHDQWQRGKKGEKIQRHIMKDLWDD